MAGIESRPHSIAPEAQATSEAPSVKERQLYRPCFDVITISGPSGTGKTTVGEALAKRYGAEFVKVGDLFRKMQEKPMVGFMEREQTVDERLDMMQVEKMREAIRERKPLVLEGRLAGFIATKLLDEAWQSRLLYETNEPRIARLVFTAESKKRFRRIRDRENKDNPGLDLSLQTATQQTKYREAKDFGQWRSVHEELKDDDNHPFHPGARINIDGIYHPLSDDPYAHFMYDHSISTTQRDIPTTIEFIDEKLLKDGLIEEIPKSL